MCCFPSLDSSPYGPAPCTRFAPKEKKLFQVKTKSLFCTRRWKVMSFCSLQKHDGKCLKKWKHQTGIDMEKYAFVFHVSIHLCLFTVLLSSELFMNDKTFSFSSLLYSCNFIHMSDSIRLLLFQLKSCFANVEI